MAKLILEKYLQYTSSGRVNDPKEYIDYLKTQPRFKNCGFDHIPKHAIILHDAEVEEHIVRLGYSRSDYRVIETGSTDPNVLYLLYGHDGDPDCIVNRGLPGGGGISTQAAELGALGVENMVHIGTCGLVGDEVRTGHVVIARASYKDGAAIMLSRPDEEEVQPLAYPDKALTKALEATLSSGVSITVGCTIPIFYFQPDQLIKDLITANYYPSGPPVGYFEMEQASFFQLCQLMDKRAASMVVGSDRYLLTDGELRHEFEDFDEDAAKHQMLKAALAAFKSLEVRASL